MIVEQIVKSLFFLGKLGFDNVFQRFVCVKNIFPCNMGRKSSQLEHPFLLLQNLKRRPVSHIIMPRGSVYHCIKVLFLSYEIDEYINTMKINVCCIKLDICLFYCICLIRIDGIPFSSYRNWDYIYVYSLFNTRTCTWTKIYSYAVFTFVLFQRDYKDIWLSWFCF